MIDTQKVRDRLSALLASVEAYEVLSQKDKTKITKGDQRRLADLDAELNLILEPQERSEFMTDVNGIARFYHVTARTVQNWVKLQACPKLRHGLYDLAAVNAWWLENIHGTEPDTEEIIELKKEHLRWKIENEKMKAQQTSRDLIPISEIAQQWGLRLAAVSTGLDMLCYQLALHCEMLDRSSLLKTAQEKIWKLKDNYCRSGQFCLPPPDGTENEQISH